MKILNEAIEELKASDFKDVYQHEANQSKSNAFKGSHGFNWVSDCQIDTDLEILFPDEYIQQITERLILYRELDETETEEQLIAFEKNLIDRFGPIPQPAKDLIKTIQLRWKAIEAGFEKIILKNNRFVGYFTSKVDSPYYDSEIFGKVLEIIKNQSNHFKLKETKQKKLTLVIEQVSGIETAIEKMDIILTGNNQ
jgi:transcription-repair coupling factor (superfamily II helicase)